MHRISLTLTAPLIFAATLAQAEPKHGISMYGDLKYGPNFEHYEYVNPNAPKGGAIKLRGVAPFDTFNPYVIKGTPAAGLGLTTMGLVDFPRDEVFSAYGEIAESVEMPADRSWVEFTLRPEATWHDGKQISVEDVIFSLNVLREKGLPAYRHYYKNIVEAKKTGERTVRFTFSGPKNLELPLISGQLPILPKHYWQGRDFNATTLEPPIGSGPYKIKSFDAGRQITYERIKDHWSQTIPTRKGQYNFDKITYVIFRDMSVSFEAFKAGEFDYQTEYDTKVWMEGYTFPAVKKKQVIKERIPDANPQAMQAFVYNIRRPIFQDRRVREALAYAYDFEWLNKNIMYDQFTRTNSYFENTELASRGLPSAGELVLLEPFRDQLPKEVFEKEYNPPSTAGDGSIRQNLRTARKLLEEAGWRVKNGKLTHENTGELFTFEIIFRQANLEGRIAPFVANLKRLGIEAKMRLIDTSQWINRVMNYEFDMTTRIIAQSDSPGNEQREFWSSETADRPGGRNTIGIKDPVVDQLIEKVISAEDRQSLVTATRALDRVLLWGHYVIPQYHIAADRIAYWNRFDRPAIKAKYAIGFLNTWWIDPAKDAALKAVRKRR